jgi:hypothetical protein
MGQQIHALSVKAVSLTISESAATTVSVTISKSTGTVCIDESTRQLWKQCH